jgi:PAS domain S-box-containing protein
MKNKILIVDDLSENINVLFDILKNNYAVVASTNAEEALQNAFTEPYPDLILLDVMMPRIDGYQLCKMLKEDDRTREIPVIFVTALDGAFDEERAFAVGGVDFISKPIIPSILRARIKTHIELLEKARELKRKFDETNVLFELQPAGIAYVKSSQSDHAFVRVNSEMVSLFGYSISDLLKLKPDSLFSIKNEFNVFIEKLVTKGSNASIFSTSIEMLRKDGSVMYCRIHGRVFQTSGETIESIWTIINMTHEHNLEQLRKHVEQISRHDLKGPLNGIINFPEMIRMESNLSEMQQKMLDMIEKSGKMMLGQINGSLNLLKLEEGNYDYRPQQFNIAEVVQETVMLYNNYYEIKTIDVILVHNGKTLQPKEYILVRADHILIGIVMSNLIGNAIDASPHNSEIRIEIVSDESKVEIHIKNQGAIPIQIRDRFFERFTTYGKSNGTGLGAYSAKRMVEAMGGSIWFETDDITGTELAFTIPQKL